MVQLARGTSGLRRWYRRAAMRPFPATMSRDGCPDHLRWPPRTDRHARARDARPAHLGHRSLQLPVHLLHAEGDLREGLRVPAARPGPDLRGDRTDGPDVRLARGREAADHRRRAARPARPAAPDRDAGGHPPARRRRDRPDPDDERVRAARARRTAGRGRPAARHGQPRFARRRDLRRDERDRLPGREGPRRDRRRHRGGAGAGQGQHGRPARRQRIERAADGAPGRARPA